MLTLPGPLNALTITLLAALPPLTQARSPYNALAEDLFAFPKYRVAFLNDFPVANQTADTWLKNGLKGGEQEFLDMGWEDTDPSGDAGPPKIGDGLNRESTDSQHVLPDYRLEFMKLGDKASYVCLIPPPIEEQEARSARDESADNNPAQVWNMLQPLSGRCLYHRQAWFTYAYCHNHQVRQFREMAHAHPHPPGYVPEEDPEWESYTLGRSPISVDGDGQALTVSQEDAISNSVELASAAGTNYLVLRWGDGTMCDKTGQPREIEVQFHCSMTVTDTILFVKEAKTCSYVMVIHTPRLCGATGFTTRLEQRKEAAIRCRQIIDDAETVSTPIPVEEQLFQEDETAGVDQDRWLLEAEAHYAESGRPTRDDALGPLPAPGASSDSAAADSALPGGLTDDMIRKAFETILSGGAGNILTQKFGEQRGDDNQPNIVRVQADDGGEYLVEILDIGEVEGYLGDGEQGDFVFDVDVGVEGGAGHGLGDNELQRLLSERIDAALRQAGRGASGAGSRDKINKGAGHAHAEEDEEEEESRTGNNNRPRDEL